MHAGYKGLHQCHSVECDLGLFVFGWRWKPCERGCGYLCTVSTCAVDVLLGSDPKSLDKSKKYFQFGNDISFLPVNMGQWRHIFLEGKENGLLVVRCPDCLN